VRSFLKGIIGYGLFTLLCAAVFTGVSLLNYIKASNSLSALNIKKAGKLDDVQSVQYAQAACIAKKYGITERFKDKTAVYEADSVLISVRSCGEFHLNPLSSSYPVLTDKGLSTLLEIGKRFGEKLTEMEAGYFKIRVTSLTRSDVSQRILREQNKSATEKSAHCFGATFDISTGSFNPGWRYRVDERLIKLGLIDIEDRREALVNILHNVLVQMKEEGKLYAMREKRCFHVTPQCH